MTIIPPINVTGVEREIISLIRYYADDLPNLHLEINNALQVRCSKDQAHFLIRRNSSEPWHKFTKKALALLIQRASKDGTTGLSYAEATDTVESLIRIAPAAINVRRRLAPEACSYCGSVERTGSTN